MAKIISTDLRGQDKVNRLLSSFLSEVEGGSKEATESSGRNILSGAKRDAPVDTGELRDSGYYEPTNKGFGAKIGFRALHAPYLEFGTGGYVDVPEGFADYAIQFKGAGIRKVNILPQPYLIPNWLREHPIYLGKIKKVVATAARKFNKG